MYVISDWERDRERGRGRRRTHSHTHTHVLTDTTVHEHKVRETDSCYDQTAGRGEKRGNENKYDHE